VLEISSVTDVFPLKRTGVDPEPFPPEPQPVIRLAAIPATANKEQSAGREHPAADFIDPPAGSVALKDLPMSRVAAQLLYIYYTSLAIKPLGQQSQQPWPGITS
jgi:hypothetical protein